MAREILFRGRSIASGGAWIYGNSLIQWGSGTAISNNIAESRLDRFTYSEVVQVCQFTGLNDCKGINIYEGDILQYKDSNGVTQIGEVKYDQNHCCFIVQGLKSAPQSLNAFWEFEVVGNVYDNPELLYMYM